MPRTKSSEPCKVPKFQSFPGPRHHAHGALSNSEDPRVAVTRKCLGRLWIARGFEQQPMHALSLSSPAQPGRWMTRASASDGGAPFHRFAIPLSAGGGGKTRPIALIMNRVIAALVFDMDVLGA